MVSSHQVLDLNREVEEACQVVWHFHSRHRSSLQLIISVDTIIVK